MKLNKLRQAARKLPPIVGVTPNALTRVVPAQFLNDYSIVCFKWRQETEYVSRVTEVFSIERLYPGAKISKMNSTSVLRFPPVQEYLSRKGKPWLLVYKSRPGLERLAQRLGFGIIGNKPGVIAEYDDKRRFREILEEEGIRRVPGESIPFEKLRTELLAELKKKYGEKIVVQAAEIAGGGKGTAFVQDEEDLESFISRIKSKEKGSRVKKLNVTKFIDGIPASIAACVTKYGIISGGIQTQIQDIPQVRNPEVGSGLFLGHDWSFRQWRGDVIRQAQELADKIGKRLKREGYKGIFGLDLVIDEEGVVYPIECNPRYTGAFPVLSQIYIANGLVPLDFYHILEHLGIEYNVDVREASDTYTKPLLGSQIILYNRREQAVKVEGYLKAGVYKVAGETMQFVREGFGYEHLLDAGEFVLTDGVPFPGTVLEPSERLAKLVFKKGILQNKNKLTQEVEKIIDWVYQKFFQA